MKLIRPMRLYGESPQSYALRAEWVSVSYCLDLAASFAESGEWEKAEWWFEAASYAKRSK